MVVLVLRMLFTLLLLCMSDVVDVLSAMATVTISVCLLALMLVEEK